MIFTDFSRALAQIGDQRFRRVVFLGVLLALALLVAVYALLLIVIQWFDPGSAELFMIGPVEGLGTLLSIGSFFLILGLSIDKVNFDTSSVSSDERVQRRKYAAAIAGYWLYRKVCA